MSDLPAFLAEQMGVSRRTVQRWFEAGKVAGAYRTRGGHWRVRRSRGRKKLWKLRETLTELERKKLDRINELVVGYTMPPARPQPPMTMIEVLKWTRALLNWQIEKEMEELTASQEFNDALEYSTVAEGICDDDMLPRGLKDIPREVRSRVVYQHFKDLEERERKKFRYLIKTPMLDLINEHAYDATGQPHGMLMVKAKKLGPDMTSEALARELKISPSTLYRRYRRDVVKRARALAHAPVLDEAPDDAVRHQLPGYRLFKRKAA